MDPNDIPPGGNFNAEEVAKVSLRASRDNGVWNLEDWMTYLVFSPVRKMDAGSNLVD